MGRMLVVLALTLISLPTWAQTGNENVTKCMSGDPDIKISGCTALIQSGRTTTANLSAIYTNRGNAYAAKGMYDRAIADFGEAIALDPGDAVAHNNRARTYLRRGRTDLAILDYTEAIKIDPNFAPAYSNRCIAYGKMGLYDNAIADCTRAIELQTDDAHAYFDRGFAYENKTLNTRAIDDYRAALKIDPNLQAARDGLKRLVGVGAETSP